jgi:alkyl hydroperoxide reductase subunit AhpC
MSKAFIQKPAPAFSAKAVDKTGEFVDIKLSDYKGSVLILLNQIYLDFLPRLI